VDLSREAEQRLGEKLADADPEVLKRALSGLLPFLSRLVEEASEERRPHALKVRAEMLGMAIDDFADTLRTRLRMPGETTEETLEHYDAHHRRIV
jgi:hypothetical protein